MPARPARLYSDMARARMVVVVLGLVGIASADERPDARAHAQRSTTLYLSTPWAPGPTVPIRIGVEGVMRVHRGHLAMEARFGAGGAASVLGLGGQYAAHGGVGLGGALSLGERVVLAPMVGYDVFVEWEQYGGSVVVQYLTVEVPVAILLGRGVVLEPFVQVGVARYEGSDDPALVIGPRLGIVL